MAKITAPIRSRGGARRFNPESLRSLVRDGSVWVDLGVVYQPNDGEHWSRDKKSIYVEVQSVTSAMEVTARLSAAAGGVGLGLWRIPDVGTEVILAMPGGDSAFMPTIVAVLDSGQAPDRAGVGRTILVATDAIELIAPKVNLGPTPEQIDALRDGLTHGSGKDPYTGLEYWQLGNTTSKVGAKK